MRKHYDELGRVCWSTFDETLDHEEQDLNWDYDLYIEEEEVK